MTVEFRTGELFASGLPAVGHGCNCAGAMGRGIAVEFRRRWPDMYEEYRRRCQAGSFRLGDIMAWEAPDRLIFNLGTQRTWRHLADLPAIDLTVRKMLNWADTHDVAAVGLPRIGAGLGGLRWPDVAAVVEAAAATSPVTVVIFELPSPARRNERTPS
jgi:O-acetyl-ADP-ribose deacetylase (regulator of RNase III)